MERWEEPLFDVVIEDNLRIVGYWHWAPERDDSIIVLSKTVDTDMTIRRHVLDVRAR